MTDTDPVDDLLGDFAMTGVFYSTSKLSAPWGVYIPALPDMVVFHVMTEGSSVLEIEGTEHTLAPGELMLVPHGTGHRIASDADAPAVDLWNIARIEASERYERMEVLGGGEPANLICGAVSFTDPALARLLKGLPPAIVARAAADREWLQTCVGLIARESRENRSGSGIVTARLADVLLVHAVRDWLSTRTPETGWLAAMRDDRIGPSLRAFHDDPGRPWTLPALAAEAGISRSGFAARFTDLVGESPMIYATGWRLDLAAHRLRQDESIGIATIAHQVGYESEPAFNRAFRRRFGVTPGAWRREGHDPVTDAVAAIAGPPDHRE